MRRLVGINAGVLNQNLAAGNLGLRILISRHARCQRGTVQADVDVSRTGNFEFFESLDLADSGDDFVGNFPWGFAKFLRQLEGERKRILSKVNLRRLLDD